MSTITERKLSGILGMAQRAGRLVSGSLSVEKSLNEKKVYGLLIASDAEDSTRQKWQKMAGEKSIPAAQALSQEAIAVALGKNGMRTAVAVLDNGFWQAIIRQVQTTEKTD